MILAAGFGTRLAPLTDDIPKALIPVAGKPMIARAVEALSLHGCDPIVVNAHHHAALMASHFRDFAYTARVILSGEAEILGTGGGLLHARPLLLGEGPFLVHNADIVTDFNLYRLIDALEDADAVAALAVNERRTSRAVLFDSYMNFLGKEAWKADGQLFAPDARRFGFCGIHAVREDIFDLGFPEGFSDIFDIYRAAIRNGWRVRGVCYKGNCFDLGTPESIGRFEAFAADR